jgi:hypothetical protein
MTKRHVRELKVLYDNLFLDALQAFPTLRVEFERDLDRLVRLVNVRGLHVFCVDLPNVGKHFDKCLSLGQYSTSGLPLTKRYTNGVVIPKFLRGLYLLVFDELGQLKDDCNIEAVFFIRQICYMAKKVEIYCGDEAVRCEVESFAVTDESLPEPEQFWDMTRPTTSDVTNVYRGFVHSTRYREKVRSVDPALSEVSSVFLKNLDIVSGLLCATLGAYHPDEWCFRHGPGAVSEVTGPSNKYCWTNWSDRLDNVFPFADYGFHNHATWAALVGEDETEIGSEDPISRLIAVPKTYAKPRLIAAEPSEHQWCQQNIWHYFCSRTSRTWISEFVLFRDQSRNQLLCRRASVDRSMATIDLSEASDRVTCHLVGQFFRSNPNLLVALQATRTRRISQNLNPKVERILDLRKFSTMGSACTFPVESLVFLGIAIAAVLTKRKLKASSRTILGLAQEVAVFGDDIVVPTDSRLLFSQALEVLDFKVNHNKSFWTGEFRESCGVDAFRGVEVTPVYWKGPCEGNPESIVRTVEVSNNFYQKWLLNTARYIASTIRDIHIPVIDIDSGVCGLRSFVTPVLGSFRNRYNEKLQRVEVLVPVVKTTCAKTAITDDSALLQYFTEKPSPSTPWKGGVTQRPRVKIRSGWVPVEEVVRT